VKYTPFAPPRMRADGRQQEHGAAWRRASTANSSATPSARCCRSRSRSRCTSRSRHCCSLSRRTDPGPSRPSRRRRHSSRSLASSGMKGEAVLRSCVCVCAACCTLLCGRARRGRQISMILCPTATYMPTDSNNRYTYMPVRSQVSPTRSASRFRPGGVQGWGLRSSLGLGFKV